MVRLRQVLFAFLLLGLLGGVSCEGAEGTKRCIPHFPASDSIRGDTSFGAWLGAEHVYSVVRDDGSSVWIFGNSLVRLPGSPDSEPATRISNTVGISHCNETTGVFKIEYHWEVTSTFAYESVFQPRNLPPRFSYEPGQPWLYHGFLFVPLLVIERVVGDVGYRIAGTHVARIWNPEDEPQKWKISYGQLFSVPEMGGGQGIIQNGKYVYFLNGITNGTVLSRLKSSDLIGSLNSLSERVEYLNSSGGWDSRFRLGNVKKIAFQLSAKPAIELFRSKIPTDFTSANVERYLTHLTNIGNLAFPE